jgi:H+/Cl- antiporter ClcA
MYKSIILCAGFFATGILIVYAGAVTALRDGEAGSRFASYNRRIHPFHFWFFVILALLGGLLACGAGLYCLFHPEK